MSATTTSVMIAGGGPVGLSLARTLSDQGIDSIVLEKNERPEQYSRTILVPSRTLDIFEGWNLAETAKARGIFMPRLQAYGAESGKVAMTINFTELADVSRNAGYLILPQDRTEELLLRRPSRASDSLLASYESERVHAIVHSVEQTSDIASKTLYFSPYAVRRLFMALFGAAMKIGPVRRGILFRLSMLNTRLPLSKFVQGDRQWAGRIAPNHPVDGISGRLFDGRRGRPFLVCYDVESPAGGHLETVQIPTAQRDIFRRSWNIDVPFCAIIRPDGFVAWAKKHPYTREIEAALDERPEWLVGR
jgi:hypothetical protein